MLYSSRDAETLADFSQGFFGQLQHLGRIFAGIQPGLFFHSNVDSILRYNTNVEPETVVRLLDLNRQFYQTFALQFSATRQRLQPGVRKILARLLQFDPILDLGCGNGELARELARQAYPGKYTGLDFSVGLLEEARRDQPQGANAVFRQVDLATEPWGNDLPKESFAAVLAFAVFHHIPSQDLRKKILGQVRSLLRPGGVLIHSNWQFLNSPRLKARLQSWQQAGLDESQVEQGVFLLDWRPGGVAYRYVHHFSAQELQLLAAETCFEVIDSYLSDGENSQLSCYQIWKPVE